MRFFEMNAHTRQDEKEESMYLKIFKERINKSPAYRFLGMKVTDISRGYSCLELDCREEIKNVQGLIHGGIICTLMDSSCGVAGPRILSNMEAKEFNDGLGSFF
jgi:acyl-coenzyme A thioesterase PaaI-like protein